MRLGSGQNGQSSPGRGLRAVATILVPYKVLHADDLSDPSQQHQEVQKLRYSGYPHNTLAVPLLLHLGSGVRAALL